MPAIGDAQQDVYPGDEADERNDSRRRAGSPDP